MMAGGIAGANVGSGFALRLTSPKLRFALSVCLLAVGIEFYLRAARL
jgi:uncharacterized membrane protein YfcA